MPCHPRRLAVGLLSLLLACGWRPVSARADTSGPVPVVEARTRFARAVELYRDGDLPGALAEFRRADELAPSYRLKYNIAQVCEEQHDYAGALSAFRAYLAGGGAEIPKARRASVELEVQKMAGFVGELAVSVDIAGAEVLLDDTAVGQAPLTRPLSVNVGRHRISARYGALVATRSVELAGGERAQVALQLSPPPPVVVSEADRERETRRREPPPADRSLAWVSGIGAGVLLASAVVTGALALHASSQLSSGRATVPASKEQLDAASARVSHWALATDVLGLLALGGGVGAVYFALAPTSGASQPASAALAIGSRF